MTPAMVRWWMMSRSSSANAAMMVKKNLPGLHDGSFGLGQSDQPLGVTWLVSDTRWVLIFAVRRSAVSDSNA